MKQIVLIMGAHTIFTKNKIKITLEAYMKGENIAREERHRNN